MPWSKVFGIICLVWAIMLLLATVGGIMATPVPFYGWVFIGLLIGVGISLQFPKD